MEQLSEETRRAIDDLQARTGYTINQRNGQRKFTDPQFDGQPPPNKGTEVYIARLPRDLYEDELIPPFEEIGEIYEARLMMDFSGKLIVIHFNLVAPNARRIIIVDLFSFAGSTRGFA